MMELLKCFKSKRIFLTGHTGFKGSWMLRWLYLLGAEVKGYALEPENDDDLFYRIQGGDYCQSVISDIRDYPRLAKEVKDFQPDFIFHFAAQPIVRRSYEIPLETHEVNIMGTANLLESLKLVRKNCVCVIITTDKVYENKEWDYPYREVDRLGGYDPYSASKACSEIIVDSYRNSFFNPKAFPNHHKSVASARAGNVIGGGDWSPSRIIPDIIRALQQDRPIEVRNPQAVRPWQHVLEPLGGYLLLASKLFEDPAKFSSGWNFGPYSTDCFTVEEIVRKAIEIWGHGEMISAQDINAPHEAGLLKLDISKSINQLGWRPKLDSDKAISWSIEFYKEPDYLIAMDRQITTYQNL